jgi:alpha-methylacyl-CoA racemase
MGPLSGVRIVELAAIGPAPFAAMLLADLGADIIRVDRTEAIDLGLPGKSEAKFDVLRRGRRSVAVDLKTAAGQAVVLRLAETADALIEGFRPGVLERLSLGPDVLLARNPRLVVGRMTGYGQDGPLAPRAGHDINYIAIAGVLGAIGRPGEAPVPPLNLIGDFGGGGMFLALGLVSAILSARATGQGQVVDASMVDGAVYLNGLMQGLLSQGAWRDERGVNMLDGGAPWYATYRTQDNQWMAVGAIEGRFYAELLEKLGLNPADLPQQHDRTGWPALRSAFEMAFLSRTRAEWETVFAASDACVTPVLSIREAAQHPHNVARANTLDRDGVLQPAPAPRFSRTRAEAGALPRPEGADTDAILRSAGYSAAEIATLEAAGTIRCS